MEIHKYQWVLTQLHKIEVKLFGTVSKQPHYVPTCLRLFYGLHCCAI